MKRIVFLIPGLLFLAMGLLGTRDLLLGRNARIGLMPESLIFLAPAFLAVGIAICSLLPRTQASVGRWKYFLAIGSLMLLVGGFPWVYTILLLGERPGNEAAGMLGTLIFVLLGLPGFLMMLVALIAGRIGVAADD